MNTQGISLQGQVPGSSQGEGGTASTLRGCCDLHTLWSCGCSVLWVSALRQVVCVMAVMVTQVAGLVLPMPSSVFCGG